MARLRIPGAFTPALAKLASLPEETAQELISAVPSIRPALNHKGVASQLSAVVKSLPISDLTDIAAALISLSATKIVNKIPLPEFLDEVCTALKAQNVPGITDCDTLRSRLSRLLESESLVLSAKASALQREQNNLLLDVRVVTDVRPVFPDGPEAVRGAMIVHSLKLSYLHNNESEEFFVAMDDDDLASLQKAVSRAEAKSKTLKGVITKAEMVDLDQK